MKKVFFLLLFMTMALCCLTAQDQDPAKYKEFKPVQFNEEISNTATPIIVDVREYFEFRKSRIQSAVNMPSSGNLEYSSDTIQKNAYIFFYCTSGFRSNRVAKFFIDKGFTNIYSLEGGITAWKKEGLPIDRKRIRKNPWKDVSR